MKTQNPLDVLFAGGVEPIRFLNGEQHVVHVRALPQRYLHHVIAVYENKPLFIELCTYTKAKKGKPPVSLFSDVPPPAGYWPVPVGWSDNLDDASIDKLYERADQLNFERAMAWARAQIIAKKKIAPLIEQTTAQVVPLVNQIMQPLFERLEKLSNSMPSAPASSASVAKTS